ncbi:TRAUB-domain-containing protein [Piedraia hortae CBS 480.64]|uniref:Protein BFR2 n=1 Tax=Piedraia hortae CBS 480.64 TaxID=1314780 RepID=A0A6A7BZ03_9PEZI|nr:TRAUB-domain-containing protein [Piedraia hortae CBS 480.64]
MARDLDPESDHTVTDESSDSEREDNQQEARSHYVNLPQSKLRKRQEIPLGPQYRGKKVGREDFEEEESEDDDPFTKGFEGSDGDSLGMAEPMGDDLSDQGDLSDEDKDEDDDDDEMEEDEKDSGSKSKESILEKQKAILSTGLGAGQKADVEKGRAVKKQRETFNVLLGTRMKLQKALIGVNSLMEANEVSNHSDLIKAAETAAFNLWSSLNKLREEMSEEKTGQKRKRPAFTINSPTSELLTHMQSQESESLKRRKTTVIKWSPAIVIEEDKALAKTAKKSVMDMLESHLANTENLFKHARTPRTCAPLQASGEGSSGSIYDDADFYGLLLKELLEQKSQDSLAASSVDLSFALRRQARVKKQNVDVRASKGRKLRYTVHKELQNIMAPENRCTWNDERTDHLFAGLFGQRITLNEEDSEKSEEEDEAEDTSTLKLFRD